MAATTKGEAGRPWPVIAQDRVGRGGAEGVNHDGPLNGVIACKTEAFGVYWRAATLGCREPVVVRTGVDAPTSPSSGAPRAFTPPGAEGLPPRGQRTGAEDRDDCPEWRQSPQVLSSG